MADEPSETDIRAETLTAVIQRLGMTIAQLTVANAELDVRLQIEAARVVRAEEPTSPPQPAS